MFVLFFAKVAFMFKKEAPKPHFGFVFSGHYICSTLESDDSNRNAVPFQSKTAEKAFLAKRFNESRSV